MPSAFPYSAPLFTDEDREREWMSLSMEERAQIQLDLYGEKGPQNDSNSGNDSYRSLPDNDGEKLMANKTFGNLEEEERRISQGLAEMEKILMDIPISEKIEYEQALIQAEPEILERESPAVAFLLKRRYDATEAVHDLLAYWTRRVALFGDQKAFLPMTIDGALRDDMGTLLTGFMQILPPDLQGRPVLLHQKSRINPVLHHRDSLGRVILYMLTILSMMTVDIDETQEHPSNVSCSSTSVQRNGIVGLNMNTKSMEKYFDRKYLKNILFPLCNKASPVRINAVHSKYPTSKRNFVQKTLPMVQYFMPDYLRKRLCMFSHKEELVEKGIPLESLPFSIGGKYDTITSFEEWVNTQIEKERRHDNR